MFFRQLLHEDHEHVCAASYVIGDAGQAVVIDPQWAIERYTALCWAYHLRITHIVETHLHSDHLSGARRLAAETGATIHVAAAARVNYPHDELIADRPLELGELRLTALAAPGHRPEHTAIVVSRAGRDPRLVLTGDSLAVGGVAPPDAGIEFEPAARALYATLGTLRNLADWVEVWPGHVAGPLGGLGTMSQKTSSTVGAERRWNRLFAVDDERSFVSQLAALNVQPTAIGVHLAETNRVRLADHADEPAALSAGEAHRLEQSGAVIVDGRTPERFDAAHIPGSINLPLSGRAVGTRAATILDPERDLVVVAENYRDAVALTRLLESAGLQGVRGALAGGISSWRAVPLAVARVTSLSAEEVAQALDQGDVILVDVREAQEREFGYLATSVHAPIELLARGGINLGDGPVVVACEVGNRAALAASVLRRQGHADVRRLRDGGVRDLLTALSRLPAPVESLSR